MKTDEELAQEYLNQNWVESNNQIYIAGLQKSRELEVEKAMRFAEWANASPLMYNTLGKMWYSAVKLEIFTTEELYASQEFADYLKQFEK